MEKDFINCGLKKMEGIFKRGGTLKIAQHGYYLVRIEAFCGISKKNYRCITSPVSSLFEAFNKKPS